MKALLCTPLVQDYVALAQRMPADEVAQYLAVTGRESYDPQEAAKTMLGTPGIVHCIATEDGRALVLGGFEQVRPGVWQCWMVSAAEDWPAYGAEFSRIVSQLMRMMLDNPDCHRLQLHATLERQRAHRWYMKALGMTLEGIHRKFFADGSDALCFALVKED